MPDYARAAIEKNARCPHCPWLLRVDTRLCPCCGRRYTVNREDGQVVVHEEVLEPGRGCEHVRPGRTLVARL